MGAAAGSQLAAAAPAAFSGYHQLILGKEGRAGLGMEMEMPAGGSPFWSFMCVCLVAPGSGFFLSPRHFQGGGDPV